MLSHLAEFVVRITDLVEAEGRDLRKVIGRLMVALVFAIVAGGLGLIGSALLLAGLWIALTHAVNRAGASAITGVLALTLAFAAFKACERFSR